MTLEAVLVAVGAIATMIAVAALAARLPVRQPPPDVRSPATARSRPSQLLRVERIVERAGESGLAAHTQLRPLLVEIAEARLGRRGLRLGDDGARDLLGPEAWELVRPDRPEPPDDRGAGVDLARARAHARPPGGAVNVGERGARILDEVERAVVGKRDALELVLLGLLADGHVLIEDNPGLAKTLMARSFAAVTGLRFTRVQFTPDLMPSDVTGSAIYDQRTGELRFQPGPIFTHVLLGRRDQPRAAEDAGGAARGDAGAAGHERGRDA